MIRFPAVDAALEGFRITREHPLAVLLWGGLVLLVNLIGQAWLLSTGAMPHLMALYAPDAAKNPEAMLAHLQAGGGPIFGFVVVAMLVNVLIYTAVIRAVLEPVRSTWGYLRLGRDELRLIGLMLLIFVGWVLYMTVIQAAMLLLASVAKQAPGVAGGLLAAAIGAAGLVALVYPVVRLSLAPAMTFADRRISLLRSWALTKEQFWGLFGAYVLAGVLAVLVMLLAALVFASIGAVGGLVSGGAFDLLGAATRKEDTLATLLTPAGLTLVAIKSVCTTLALVIVMAVGPAAFRMLADRAGPPATKP